MIKFDRIARMSQEMPLPPEWRKIVDVDAGKQLYHNISEDVYLEFNPSEPFIFFLVDRARK